MKFFKKIFIILIIFIISVLSIFSIIGYSYYSFALKEKPLLERVKEVKSDEHFVKFEDMSPLYRNAVIAVEDHRYYDHGPVDFIALARAMIVNIKNIELSAHLRAV